ncbi:MAG: glycosyltransferase family 2 protein [Patescibacteria group bacterium]
MRISCIIVNYQRPALLRLALQSLSRAVLPTTDLEVIIVDSASTPETRAVVRDEGAALFQNIVLVPRTENTGYTKGNILGVERATGDYICILNPDIVPEHGSLEMLAHTLEEHPAIGLVAPTLFNFDGTVQASTFRMPTLSSILARRMWIPGRTKALNAYLYTNAQTEELQEVDWALGAALMTRRETLQRVGFFNPTFFHYLSDVDWARRIWDNRLTVVRASRARMYHYLRRESKGRFWLWDALMKQTTRRHILDGMRYLRTYGLFPQRLHT